MWRWLTGPLVVYHFYVQCNVFARQPHSEPVSLRDINNRNGNSLDLRWSSRGGSANSNPAVFSDGSTSSTTAYNNELDTTLSESNGVDETSQLNERGVIASSLSSSIPSSVVEQGQPHQTQMEQPNKPLPQPHPFFRNQQLTRNEDFSILGRAVLTTPHRRMPAIRIAPGPRPSFLCE